MRTPHYSAFFLLAVTSLSFLCETAEARCCSIQGWKDTKCIQKCLEQATCHHRCAELCNPGCRCNGGHQTSGEECIHPPPAPTPAPTPALTPAPTPGFTCPPGFTDSTNTAATVYKPDGTPTDTTEDRHRFSRFVTCNGVTMQEIKFRTIECTCQTALAWLQEKWTKEASSMPHCTHNGKHSFIIANFSAEMQNTSDVSTCPEATSTIAGIYVNDVNGSYLAMRSTRAAEFTKAVNQKYLGATSEVQYTECLNPGCDKATQPDGTLTCKNSDCTQFTTCSRCVGKACENYPYSAELGIYIPWVPEKRQVCGFNNGGNWISRTNMTDQWPTSPNHVDWLANPGNRRILEEELEAVVQQHSFVDGFWVTESDDNEAFKDIGSKATFGKNWRTSSGDGTHNCCAHTCPSSHAAPPLLWDQDALEVTEHITHSKTLERFAKGVRAYPAVCTLPSEGMPEHAHMLRISPCGGDKNNEAVFCAIIKITVRKDNTTAGPVVQGYADIAKSPKGGLGRMLLARYNRYQNTCRVTEKCENMDHNGFGTIAVGLTDGPGLSEYIRKPCCHPKCGLGDGTNCGNNSTGCLERAKTIENNVCGRMMAFGKFVAAGDSIIRDAIAKVRFRIGEKQ